MTTNLENFIITAELLKQAAAEQEQEMRTVANPLGIGAAVGGAGATAYTGRNLINNMTETSYKDSEDLFDALLAYEKKHGINLRDPIDIREFAAKKTWPDYDNYDGDSLGKYIAQTHEPEMRAARALSRAGDDSPLMRVLRGSLRSPGMTPGRAARTIKDDLFGINTNRKTFLPRYGKNIGGLAASLLPTLWGLGNLTKEVPTPQQSKS